MSAAEHRWTMHVYGGVLRDVNETTTIDLVDFSAMSRDCRVPTVNRKRRPWHLGRLRPSVLSLRNRYVRTTISRLSEQYSIS